MSIYIYAIVDSNEEMDEVIKGIDGAPAHIIPYRDIGIVASDLDPQIQIKTDESVFRHEEVVEVLMDRFTVLPMSLYTIFGKNEEMILKVKEHYEDFIENLDRVRGKREYGIKVIWPGSVIKERIVNARKNEAPPADPARPGVKFMKVKFERYKIDREFAEEADRCIAIVDGFLNRIASEKKLEKLKTDDLLLSAAYLVDKEKGDDFKKAFEDLRSSGGDLKYMLSGPWPAYNFITLSRSGEGKFGSPDLIETILQHKYPEDKDGK